MGEWTVQGSQDVGEIYLNNAVPHTELFLGLFTNDLTDLNNATLGSLVEPTASDYARIPMSPANWVVANELAVYPTTDFEVASEPLGTIYGCFICTVVSGTVGKLLAVNKFATPIVLDFFGDMVEITPRISIT
jgi:hypothetical protein